MHLINADGSLIPITVSDVCWTVNNLSFLSSSKLRLRITGGSVDHSVAPSTRWWFLSFFFFSLFRFFTPVHGSWQALLALQAAFYGGGGLGKKHFFLRDKDMRWMMVGLWKI